MQYCDQFLDVACSELGVEPPPQPHLPAPPGALSGFRLPVCFEKVPDLPAHVDDTCWDGFNKRVWIQVDCLGVANVSQGDAVLSTPRLEPIFRRITEYLPKLGDLQWEPRRDIDPYIIWAKREYNTPPDHLANAAMDADMQWEWRDEAELEQIKRSTCGMKICIDGGLRAEIGAIAFACYSFTVDASHGPISKPAWMNAQPVRGMHSAFETEATALEWSLTCLTFFLGE